MGHASDHARDDAPALAGRAAGAFGLWRRVRVLRFLVVGALNTAFGYVAFLAALAVMPGRLSALTLATIVAILFNFVSLGSWVFGSTDPRRLWRFGVTYGIVFGYNVAGQILLERAGIGPRTAGLLLLPGTAILSYGINRSFVFAARR